MLQKPIVEVGTGVVGIKGVGAAIQKKECENQKPKNVVIISPEEEELKLKDENPLTGGKSRQGSSKKTAKTLTSILSARSKVYFQFRL